MDQKPWYNPFYRTKEQLEQDDAERTAKEKRFIARVEQSRAIDRAERAAVLERERTLIAEGKVIPINRPTK
jgi:hypothetical protein